MNDKPAWILDAKSPLESVSKSKHIEQAYSYAIHSEVRVNYFALCNGRDFALYDISTIKPILEFPVQSIPLYWKNLKRYLQPETIFSEDRLRLAKDLGLHLKRLGFDSFDSLIFQNVPLTHIGQLDPDMFSSSGTVIQDGVKYVVSFDFGFDVFNQLKGKIPKQAIDILLVRENGQRKSVNFSDRAFYINIDCRIGDKLEENEDEIFLPMLINRIIG